MGASFAMTLQVNDPFSDIAHAMAAALAGAELASAADALNHLRRAFPQAPLRTRVAAAHVLLERLRRTFET